MKAFPRILAIAAISLAGAIVFSPLIAALFGTGLETHALADAFRRYTIASYVANFDSYSGQRFDTAPVVRAVGNDRVVETRFASPGDRVHAMDYVMRQEGGGWKVIDVLAEGSISRVASQRSEMRSLLADGGGPGLLVSLRQKTAELSGGILQ